MKYTITRPLERTVARLREGASGLTSARTLEEAAEAALVPHVLVAVAVHV